VTRSTLAIETEPPDLRLSGRTAAALGGVLSYRPGASWSVELRPAWAGAGANVWLLGSSTEIEASYVEVPLLVTYDLLRGKTRPYLLAGGAAAFQTSARAVSAVADLDLSEDFASTDWSIRLGAGVRFSGPAAPFLEIEYGHGLRDLNAAGTGLGAGLGSIRNRGLQFRAGFAFRAGGE
jgi:hypothetical protein